MGRVDFRYSSDSCIRQLDALILDRLEMVTRGFVNIIQLQLELNTDVLDQVWNSNNELLDWKYRNLIFRHILTSMQRVPPVAIVDTFLR